MHPPTPSSAPHRRGHGHSSSPHYQLPCLKAAGEKGSRHHRPFVPHLSLHFCEHTSRHQSSRRAEFWGRKTKSSESLVGAKLLSTNTTEAGLETASQKKFLQRTFACGKSQKWTTGRMLLKTVVKHFNHFLNTPFSSLRFPLFVCAI